VFLQVWRGSYSQGNLWRSYICFGDAHREFRRRECSRQVSAICSHFCFWIYTSTHIFVLSDGSSALQLACEPRIIAALRAAGAHEEEPEDGEVRDLEQDGESEEDD
jgi:hypothetical protein